MFGNKKLKELLSKIETSLSAENPMRIEFSGDTELEQVSGYFNQLINDLSQTKRKAADVEDELSNQQSLSSQLEDMELAISQLGAIGEMGKKLASNLSLDVLLSDVFNLIASNFMVKEIELVLLKDGEAQRIYSIDKSRSNMISDMNTVPQMDRFMRVTQQSDDVLLQNVPEDYGQYFFEPIETTGGVNPGGYFSCALGEEGKEVGVFCVSVENIDAFSEYDISVLKSISAYLAIAIENSTLFAEVQENLKVISTEKKKSDELLLNILPEEVASELKQNGYAEAKHFEEVSVLFTDFVGFTRISQTLSPKDLVAEIDSYFSEFDRIMVKHGIEKIKTIGDAYMAVCGLPAENHEHALKIIRAAKDIVAFVADRKSNGGLFDIRVGINTGSVVAGIIGIKKYAYDIWGDTVNTAARMESNSEAGRINISETTYELIKSEFNCTYRGEIEAKNKGLIKMYFVD
ncbi:MAG: adenylate/guanylate cyclase domain-containing protein [Bacteroidia bacterium]